MKRIALDSVVATQAYLANYPWPKAIGNFPGVLVLKRANVTVDTWTAVSPTDFAVLCDAYFRIDGAPDKSKPYYFPMRGWRHKNWPRGDVYTRFKDTSPLPKLQYLESRGVQDSWEWRFVDGYEQVLPKYVGDAGVPLLDLAAWMYRDAEWPEDATAEDVTAQFLAEFNIAEAERRLLFSSKSSLDAARLFGESWEQDSLLDRLPSPSTPSEPAATLKVVGSEAPSDYGLDTLVDELQLDSESVQLWLASIERKGQAVFYGPPGTGKTYAAQCVAKHIAAQGDGFYRTLQFHPSYAYEDFIQGIRPDLDGTDLTYQMHLGQFLEFCNEARQRSGVCVLILDEMNRANLSRVFGELMFALEYRDVSVPLAIGGSLAVPGNVRLLGTMNTADRSIALVDHALRRRFAFLAIRPNFEVLDRYHQSTGFDPTGLETVLTKVNAAIGDENYSIGVSFFLIPDVSDQMQAIWTTEIVPYLEEYFYDQPGRARAFDWKHVSAEIMS